MNNRKALNRFNTHLTNNCKYFLMIAKLQYSVYVLQNRIINYVTVRCLFMLQIKWVWYYWQKMFSNQNSLRSFFVCCFCFLTSSWYFVFNLCKELDGEQWKQKPWRRTGTSGHEYWWTDQLSCKWEFSELGALFVRSWCQSRTWAVEKQTGEEWSSYMTNSPSKRTHSLQIQLNF